jgi:uncharacterized protein (TIGR00299 family) protein
MCLGALVDAGVPLKEMEKGLKALPVRGYRLEAKRVKRASFAATKVDVILVARGKRQKVETKRWNDIERIIKASSLPNKIKQTGLKIFRRLFVAEGKVHGIPYNRTHLHELGAVDCMVDIFGTLIGLDFLDVDTVYASAVNLGSGSVMTEHGRLPVPAPATAEILKGSPVYSSDIPYELTTPTGAAILRELADEFVVIPPTRVNQIGYGAGRRDIKGFPNTLRIFLCDDRPALKSKGQPQVIIMETNIDDMNPQIYEHVMERLFGAGALDVFLTQVIMKKSRPGVLITVLCQEDKGQDIADILFKETTTIGIRFYEASRIVLDRGIKELGTEFGKVRAKVARMQDGTLKFTPEYEDCKRIAKKHRVPLIQVMRSMNNLS